VVLPGKFSMFVIPAIMSVIPAEAGIQGKMKSFKAGN
jgi:hypothetical protein